MTRYTLHEKLGRGGMATVYRATDETAEIDVAIKILHKYLAHDEGIAEAFSREAKLMQRLDHRGVATVFSTTEIDGRPAMVLEYCPGGDLREHLAREGKLSQEQAVQIAVDILETLEIVHQAGIIHRDIKPGNLLFDADGRPRLIDFGIGQAEALMEAEESGQVGTVEYMAPERVDGWAVDARSDVYSVGVMLFEMVCGHVPYRADSAAAVMRMHREAPVPDPGLFEPGLPGRIRRIIERAMAKHPEDRFDSAEAMKAALLGTDEAPAHIEEHPGWRSLNESWDLESWMPAPIESEGHEWVVVTRLGGRNRTGTAIKQAAAIRGIIDEFEAYLTFERKRPGEGGFAASTLGPSVSVKQQIADDWRGYKLRNSYGDLATLDGLLNNMPVARGLSQRGAEALVEKLESHGGKARALRRRRTRVDRHGGQERLGQFAATTIAAIVVAFITLGFFINLAENPPDNLLALSVLVPFFAVCFSGGALLGLSSFLAYGSSAPQGSALFDFCVRRDDADGDNLVTSEHVELAHSVHSPRIAASYRRAMNMALYLGDLLKERDLPGQKKVAAITAQLTELVRHIIDLEEELAALRPTALVAQIRHLDRQIAGEDDVDTIDDLLAKKEDLRRRLERRDTFQQRVETMAQRLLVVAGQLEDLVRQYEDESQESAPVDDGEVVATFEGLEELAVFKFDVKQRLVEVEG